jgi:uncharacterized protein (TIGR00369 family)
MVQNIFYKQKILVYMGARLVNT